MRILVAFVFVLVCAAAPATSFAQSGDLEAAKGHFAKGAEFYAAGEYSKAIVEFISGHNIAPNAMFLYNISLCYERLENLDDAQDAALKARNFDGMSDEIATRNEARIASFSTIMGASDVAVAVSEAPDPVEEPPAEGGGFGVTGWSGVGLTIVGGAGIAVATILAGQVSDDLEVYEQETDYAERVRLRDSIESDKSTGRILLIGGIGLSAIGVSLILWDLLDDDSADTSVSLSPSIGDSEAGVVVQGRF